MEPESTTSLYCNFPRFDQMGKHGPAFAKAYNGRFKDMACKSGSMVTKIEHGKQVLAKIDGKYFMYWGEHMVGAATSDDLVNWTPVLDDKMNWLSLSNRATSTLIVH